MRCLFFLILVGVATPALAQPFPPFSHFVQSYEPLHDSEALAFGISAGATALFAGVGYLLVLTHEPATASDDGTVAPGFREAGIGLMIVGLLLGPPTGNATLGAGPDVFIGTTIKLVGVGVAGALVMTAVIGNFDCGVGCPKARPFLTAGAVVLAAGTLTGTIYDFATIPRNARRASERRAGHGGATVSLVPATGATGLGLRVAF